MSDKDAVRTCIYCRKEKSTSEFSLEHIFPDALGGALLPDAVFKTHEVCRQCNNTAGLFVDGLFIKNWFRTNDEAGSSQIFMDPRSQKSIYPLSYMGIVDGAPVPAGDICEMWLGPCGVRYYHVHQADDPRWSHYAGGNPIARKSDPGRVYIRFTTQQNDWVLAALRSLLAYFPNARRYAPEAQIELGEGSPQYVHQMDNPAMQEAEKIVAMPDEHNMHVPIDPGFEQRFMAKLAFGVAYNVLGETFLETSDAEDLRNAMWEQHPEKRAQFLTGTGFLKGAEDKTAEFVGWEGAYTIRLQTFTGPDRLVLSLHLPSTRVMHVVASNSSALLSMPSLAHLRDGIVVIVSPQLGEAIGPLPMPQYVSHKLGNIHVPELDALEKKRIDPNTLPPCR